MVAWLIFIINQVLTEKANDLVSLIAARYEEDLSYYTALSDKHVAQYQNDIQDAMYGLQRLVQVTNQNKQPELSKEIEESFYAYISSLKLQ